MDNSVKCPYCGFELIDRTSETKSNEPHDIECIHCFSTFTCQDGVVGPSIRASARRMVQKIFNIGLFFVAVTGVVIIFPLIFFAFDVLVDFLDKNRQIVGITHTPGTFDTFIFSGVVITCILTYILIRIIHVIYWKLFTFYRPESLKLSRRLQKTIPFSMKPSEDKRRRSLQTEYIQYLIKNETFPISLNFINQQRKKKNQGPINFECNIAGDEVRDVADQILQEQSKWIRSHALITGLAVGVSQTTLYDRIILAFSSWSMYREVLRRLGKRPSWSLNLKIMQYAFGSLALNTFLQSNDAFAVKFVLKSIGWGVESVADIIEDLPELFDELGEDMSEFFENVDLDDDIDDFFDTIQSAMASVGGGDIASLGKLIGSGALTSAQFAMGIGRNAARKIWDTADEHADDILQGLVAAAFLYNLGMKTAVHCLAVDKQHLMSPGMSCSFSKALWTLVPEGGKFLRDRLKKTRDLLRKKRLKVLSKLNKYIPKKLRSSKESKKELEKIVKLEDNQLA